MYQKTYSSFSCYLLTAGQTIVLYASFAAFFVLSVLDIHYSSLGNTQIFFFLMAIFYWGVNRPYSLPHLVTFILGLCIDFLEDSPIGLNALLFFALQWLVIDQRKILRGQPFWATWLGFASVVIGYAALKNLFFNMYLWDFALPAQLWRSVVLSILAFPAVHVVLHAIQKIVTYEVVESSFRLGD